MIRRDFCAVVLLALAALVATACHRAVAPPAVTAADFHHSDPATVGSTGRPQLLEFFGPT
jgi:hypothetical protein